MFLLFKKNKNVGEIRVIVTELDRAARLVDGANWVSLNHVINEFNKDPNVKNIYLTAAFAGNVSMDTLNTYCNMWGQQPQNQLTNSNQEKQKVDTDGNSIEESHQTIDAADKLKSFLDDVDLTCTECKTEHSALIDGEGNVYPCKSCLQIDAYIKGKKEGFDAGYDKGYKDCMDAFQKIMGDKSKDDK